MPGAKNRSKLLLHRISLRRGRRLRRPVGVNLHHRCASARQNYYVDHFHLSLKEAGIAAGSFGLLALFARALGGWVSDKAAALRGLEVRATQLCALVVVEGLGVTCFAHANSISPALVAMLVFGLFLLRSQGGRVVL